MSRGTLKVLCPLAMLAVGALPWPALAQGSDPRFGPGEVTEVPGRDAILIELADEILPAVQRRDTRHAVFHGCVDWHSSVHAHWALLRVARVTGRAEDAAAWVERSLDLGGLAREAALLHNKPRFERPYGRAWFLRLAQEYERWAHERGRPQAQRLRGIAEEVADGLLRRYRRGEPTPQDGNYGSSAWALAQLHAWFTFRGRVDEREAVEAIVQRHFRAEAGPALSFADDGQRPDFFSRYGAWVYLVAHTQSPQPLADLLTQRPLRALEPFPLLEDSTHHLGIVWSRAWALRALSRRVPGPDTRRQLDRAFRAHVQQGLTQHARFADDYRAYGHWVPQFAVYALTEGERPRFFH